MAAVGGVQCGRKHRTTLRTQPVSACGLARGEEGVDLDARVECGANHVGFGAEHDVAEGEGGGFFGHGRERVKGEEKGKGRDKERSKNRKKEKDRDKDKKNLKYTAKTMYIRIQSLPIKINLR